MFARGTVLLPVGVPVGVVHANDNLPWTHVGNDATPLRVLSFVNPVVKPADTRVIGGFEIRVIKVWG